MANPVINMTTTMGQMADQLRLHTKLQQFFAVGGITGEPMSGIANRVMQKLFQKRMPWDFNEAQLAPYPYGGGTLATGPSVNSAAPGGVYGGNFMVNQQGFQRIKFAGASVFVLLPTSYNGISGQVPSGGCGVDLAPITRGNFTYPPMNGGTASVYVSNPSTGEITVQTLDPHPYQSQNVGGPVAYLTGIANQTFNSVYCFNNQLSTAQWTQGYSITSIIDLFHFTLQGTLGQHYATLTAVSASTGVTTVTVTNSMAAGDIMTFAGVGANGGLNGTIVTLLSANATSVTFTTPTGVTIINGSDTGTIYAAPSGAPGIFDWGWIQSADVYDLNSLSFPMPLDQIKASHRVSKEYSTTGDKLEVSLAQNFNNGVLWFSLTEPLGTYPFAIGVTYQKRHHKMTQATDVFQWPDDLSDVLFEMCLWQGMRFAYGISAAETEAQMGVAFNTLMAVLESQDREDNTMAITPDWSIMR